VDGEVENEVESREGEIVVVLWQRNEREMKGKK
jgi:hypothetical protein